MMDIYREDYNYRMHIKMLAVTLFSNERLFFNGVLKNFIVYCVQFDPF